MLISHFVGNDVADRCQLLPVVSVWANCQGRSAGGISSTGVDIVLKVEIFERWFTYCNNTLKWRYLQEVSPPIPKLRHADKLRYIEEAAPPIAWLLCRISVRITHRKARTELQVRQSNQYRALWVNFLAKRPKPGRLHRIFLNFLPRFSGSLT